jgi:hypothetical protein
LLVRITDPLLGFSLSITYPRVYTGAFCAAGLAPVTLVKLEDAPASNVTVTLLIRSLSYGAAMSLSGSANTWRPPIPLPETMAMLEHVTQRQPGDLSVLTAGKAIASPPIVIMDAWSWPHDAEARMVAGSYVMPGDRTIARTISEVFGTKAEDRAERWGRWEATAAAVALYRHLSGSWSLRYAAPQILIDSDLSASSHQKVASPQDVLSDWTQRAGSGNCLDLTLLFAGCFESMGLQPLLFFVGEPGLAPSHAFPGLWSVRGRRFQPLLTDAEELKRRLMAGDIIAFEATGVCAGSTTLSFDAAVDTVRKRFVNGEPLHAIDVVACRPPTGRVRPLELPNAPLVQKAMWEGQNLALETGARRLETLHLLYGLCTAGGEVTRSVFDRAGIDAKRLVELIARPRAVAAGELPPPTQNYEQCWSVARAYARANGHSRLEEIDIWWALVENPGRNLPKVLSAAGGDLVRIGRELVRWGGRPGLQSISVDIPRSTE